MRVLAGLCGLSVGSSDHAGIDTGAGLEHPALQLSIATRASLVYHALPKACCARTVGG